MILLRGYFQEQTTVALQNQDQISPHHRQTPVAKGMMNVSETQTLNGGIYSIGESSIVTMS